jgi:hypothetical protein
VRLAFLLFAIQSKTVSLRFTNDVEDETSFNEGGLLNLENFLVNLEDLKPARV